MNRKDVRRDRLRVGTALGLATLLAALAGGGVEARGPAASLPAVPPLNPAYAGPPIDPNWQKHVFVVTDSVMLSAKEHFTKALPDWKVTFTGRVSLTMERGLSDYILSTSNTGPVAVVALGYNTYWEKDRLRFKTHAERFDNQAEKIIAALKARGAKKIVWVLLREIPPEIGAARPSQYREAYLFSYVNERLKLLKERHPELALADWADAAKISGITDDLIHLNGRGGALMTEVIKVAMGVSGGSTQTPPSTRALPAQIATFDRQPSSALTFAPVPGENTPPPRVDQRAEVTSSTNRRVSRVAESREARAAPPLDPALAAAPLEPGARKHVFVVTDSVMLGAKQQFINALPDWQVTFTGRPALMVDKGMHDYVLGARDTGPVAVVALGYNTLWEKDRQNFKRWADRFDGHVEAMLAALKQRGARKIVWVMLRHLTPDMVTSGNVSRSQYDKYAWYFPYVNERLRAIKERHPEMALADWATAGKINGVTYDLIHLNSRGAELMTEVVKTAMGLYGEPGAPAQAVAARAPAPQAPAAVPPVQDPAPRDIYVEEPARPRTDQPARRVLTTVETRRELMRPAPSQAAVEPVRVQPVSQRVAENLPAESTQPTEPRKPTHMQRMFDMSQFRTAPVVMLGDSLTQRAQWSEITGCGFVVNRGIGGDVSAGVLRRLDGVTKLKPAAVFLMIGINDIARKVPNDQIVGNVRRIIETLNESGAKVYLELVLPVSPGYVPRMNPTVAELNSAYVSLARQTNATIVDFRQEVRGDEGGLRNEMTVDGIHLSTEGYRVWRDAVTPLVARHCAPAGELVAKAARPKAVVAMPLPAQQPAAPPSLAVESVPVAQLDQPRVVRTVSITPAAQPAPQAAKPAAQAAQHAPQAAEMTASIPVRAVARGAWIIQVGAYPEEEKAQERIRQAQDLGKDLLGNANPFTEKVVKGTQELYRARFAGFSQSSAEAACSYFKRNAIDCISMKR